MANPGATLSERVRKLQATFVRELNDQHIFVHQALPVLRNARKEYARSTDPADRKYFVPSRTKRGIARRTDAELKEIYDAFLDRELFATSLIAAVSRCEAFIFDVLRVVIREYPGKLAINTQGARGEPSVPLSAVINAEDLEDVLEAMIARRLHSASYAAPREYLQYFSRVTGIKVEDSAFRNYIEIKATRDLLVHNSGIVNEVYLEKVGRAKRAAVGKRIPTDQAYYDDSIAILKRVANVINEGAWEVFYGAAST